MIKIIAKIIIHLLKNTIGKIVRFCNLDSYYFAKYISLTFFLNHYYLDVNKKLINYYSDVNKKVE